MASKPLGSVARATVPRFTLVDGVSVGGTNRSVRPAHGSGCSSLLAGLGAGLLSPGGSGVAGGTGGGGVVLAGCASAAVVRVQLHNSAARILCARIISCLR